MEQSSRPIWNEDLRGGQKDRREGRKGEVSREERRGRMERKRDGNKRERRKRKKESHRGKEEGNKLSSLCRKQLYNNMLRYLL